MRTLRVSVCLGIAVALGALATPATAPASDGDRFPLFSDFQLRGSNGYRIRVLVVGNWVLLRARSGRVSGEYLVKGRVDGQRLEAQFGSLGQISVRFRRDPHENGPGAADCGDLGDLTERGEFLGTIQFVGESEYTAVEATEAPGSAFVFPSKECGRATLSRDEVPLTGITTHLYAISKGPQRLASLNVFGFPGRGRVFVVASLAEQRGAMTVNRMATAVVGGGNSFFASGVGKPGFAFLKPPKPFSGNATFGETGDSSSAWTGSLAAWLPGLGKVSFAGPAFASDLCRRTAKSAGCPLFPTVKRPLMGQLQESGSQSQAAGDARLSWSR